MGSRGRMTMRAVVERNTESGADPYGNPLPAVFAAHETFACFVWSSRTTQVVDGNKTALIEDIRGIFPLTADLLENDEIASVTDRQGVEIIPGRLRVAAEPQRKHDHQEANLERVS